MVLGTHPDTGAIDRSTLDRWDNSACEIGITIACEDVQTITVVDPTFGITITSSDAELIEVTQPLITGYTDISALLDWAEVRRSVAQPFWTGRFHFRKGTTGGWNSSIFFSSTPTVLLMPDYTGKYNAVFCGVLVGEEREHNSWASEETIVGYSYAWYLSQQHLPDIPNSRLGINNLVSLIYDPRSTFDPPNNNVMYPDIYIHGLLGRNLNVYSDIADPPLPGEWYVDDSGKDYWKRITNLYPVTITRPVTHTGYTPPPFVHKDFTTTTKKQQALTWLDGYYRYKSYDKWYYDATNAVYQPTFYWVPFVDIDSAGAGFALPAKATLTPTPSTAADLGNFLVGKLKVDQKGDERRNFVTVRCQELNGTWLQHVNYSASVFHPVYNSGASSPYELPLELYKEDPDICTQTDCTNEADDFFSYYVNQVLTFRGTFKKRSDLELYQLVAISGFGTSVYGQIEDGDYRIIDIVYRLRASQKGITHEVEVVFMKADKFAAYQNLSRTYDNSILTIQNIVRDMQASKNQSIIAYPMQAYASGPCPVWVRVQLVSSTVTVQKLAYYPGTAALTTSDKMLLSVSASGKLIATKAA